MSSPIQETFAQAQAWTLIMGAVLQEQALKIFRGFQTDVRCSISRGPKLANFDNGEILSTPHFLVDAKLEDCKASFGGTFLLPSITPEPGPEKYVVVIDDSTGIYHVARAGPSMPKKFVKPVTYGRQWTARLVTPKKERAPQFDRVVMPKGFDIFSCVKSANTPAFGCPKVNTSCAGTVSVMDSFKAILSASQDDSAVRTTANSNIKALDSAIVHIGRPSQKLAAADTTVSDNSGKAAKTVFFESLLNKGQTAQTLLPIEIPSSLSVDSANSVFFKSLLTREPIIQEATTADSAYFESLLTKKSNAHTAPPAFVSAKTESNSVNKLCLESLMTSMNLDSISHGHVELEDTTTSKFTETPTSASWPEHSAIEMGRSISSLKISLPYSVTKPRILLSELNLDVTPEQTARFLKDPHHPVEHLDSATGPTIGCVERDEVRSYRPIAPRPDDMSYEDCLLSSSFATSESSETLVEEMELHRQSISTPLSSSSDNQMFHLLKQEPLEESRWIDLNEGFQTVADTPEVVTDVASLRLPTTDKRQIQRLLGGNDVQDLPVVASSCESMNLPAEQEEKKVRICLPGPPYDLLCSTSLPIQADSDEARQIAIKNLDLDAIFGESPHDWSDDPDLDDNESDQESPAMSADAAQAEGDTKNIMSASNDHLGQTKVERTADLDAIVASKASPLKVCDRLPTTVIEAINLEQCRIWDFEGPWTIGSDEDGTYEMAVENIRRVRDDVPGDILFWINEVNGEYTRLVIEGQERGSVRDADAQRQQLITLATSNVEWHYFRYCLEESPKAKPYQPISEVSESPKDWILKVVGGEPQQSQALTSTRGMTSVATEVKAATHDDEHISSTTSNDSDVDGIAAAAAASFRAIYGHKLKQLFDPNNPHGSTGPSMTRSVIHRHVAASSLAHFVSIGDEDLETLEQAPGVAAAATNVVEQAKTEVRKEVTEVAAPVTPELLLKLPNRSDDTQHIRCPVAETNTFECNAPEDEHEKKADVESSSSAAGTTARSSRTTSRSDAATDVTDLEDFDASFIKEYFVSKLRPHRFFDIEDSKAKASDISCFREQTAVQAVLDKIIMDLPEFASEEDEDGVVDSDDLVERLALNNVVPISSNDAPEIAKSDEHNSPISPSETSNPALSQPELATQSSMFRRVKRETRSGDARGTVAPKSKTNKAVKESIVLIPDSKSVLHTHGHHHVKRHRHEHKTPEKVDSRASRHQPSPLSITVKSRSSHHHKKPQQTSHQHTEALVAVTKAKNGSVDIVWGDRAKSTAPPPPERESFLDWAFGICTVGWELLRVMV